MARRPMGDSRGRAGGMMPREGQGRPFNVSGRGGRTVGMAKVYIGAGKEAGIRPGDLVGGDCQRGRTPIRMLIGAVEVMDRFSLVGSAGSTGP